MARTDQPHKLTFDAFVEKCTDFENPLNEKHRTLDYSRPETRAAWNGSKSKIPIWCEVHEEFFVQLAANHMALGQGCPKCGKDVYKAKRRKADPIGEFRSVHGDAYDYSRIAYANVHTPVEIICPQHGSFWQKPNRHLSGDGCPSCWEGRRKNFGAERNEEFVATFADRARKIHNGAYEIVRHPAYAQDEVVLRCPRHGEFSQKAYSHLAGHGCWSCGQTMNRSQLEVAEFIKSFGVRVEHENRDVLGGLHIDIWVPDLKVGVEYHGAYWHTEERVGNKHQEKYLRSVSAGVRLIQIFDFEWIRRRTAVENRLRAIFSREPAIAARKCEVGEVSRTEASAFFDQNHTQGRGILPVVAYGLRHEGELVAVMSFGMARNGREGWELLRYASKGRVQGGFNRLFSAFRRDKSPAAVTSFCDLRWGDGRVYKQAGFLLDGVTRPDFWYVDRRGQVVPRQSLWRAPDGMTQSQWVDEQGYKKVLGVGHQRWVWKPEGDYLLDACIGVSS